MNSSLTSIISNIIYILIFDYLILQASQLTGDCIKPPFESIVVVVQSGVISSDHKFHFPLHFSFFVVVIKVAAFHYLLSCPWNNSSLSQKLSE